MQRRFLLQSAGIAAAVAGLQWPAHAQGSRFPSEIRLGLQKGDPFVALRASGRLEKAFKPHGVQVKWTEFVYGEPLVEAINAGHIDVGIVGSAPPIFAQAGKAPEVTYLAAGVPYRSSYAIVVPENSSVRTLADLRGRKIAAAQGSQGHIFVLLALRDAQIPTGGVDGTSIIFLSYADARSAFEKGVVDAWAVPDPRLADVELHSKARPLVTLGELSTPQYSFYIGPRQFAQTYGVALRILFHQVELVVADALARPAETVALLASNTGVPKDVWSHAVGRLDWGVKYPITPDIVSAQQATADLAAQYKLIPRRISVREAIVAI